MGATINAERTFILELGRALHVYGTPSHRLEEALVRVAEQLGVEVQVFSTPTSLFASFGDHETEHVSLVRVGPGETQLEMLADLQALADRINTGEIDADQGTRELRLMLRRDPRYGRLALIASYGLVSGSAALFFGGGLAEITLGFLMGVLVATVGRLLTKTRRGAQIISLAATFLAALLAGLVSEYVYPLATFTVTLASLIVLVPGLTLTVSMNELAARHLVSGAVRLISAGIVFIEIGFGVGLGTRVATLLGAQTNVEALGLPGWSEAIALVLTALGLTVVFRAHPSAFPWILLATGLGLWGARGGHILLGPELGPLAGALLVGLASNAIARLRRRPAAETLLPGILLLVPGSLGFRSVSFFLAGDTAQGIEVAFSMTMVAFSIVAGLLVAHVLLPSRKAL